MDWIATILIAWTTWYLSICTVTFSQQSTEHSWETRLRAVETEQAKSRAVAEQALAEAKEIIKNRTERIEQLERWKREQDQHAADGVDPAAKAEEAKQAADELAAKVEAAVGKDNPLLIAFGGASGVAALLVATFGYLTRGALKRLRAELEENESLPSTSKGQSSIGGIAPLNPIGLAGIKSGGD